MAGGGGVWVGRGRGVSSCGWGWDVGGKGVGCVCVRKCGGGDWVGCEQWWVGMGRVVRGGEGDTDGW